MRALMYGVRLNGARRRRIYELEEKHLNEEGKKGAEKIFQFL